MILIDTSVWVDHLRDGDRLLAELLNAGRVLAHPFVLGEIALGHLRRRETILAALHDLPRAPLATDAEVLALIGSNALMGLGIGYVDAHLLAAARLAASQLWTRDRRLARVAMTLGLAAELTP